LGCIGAIGYFLLSHHIVFVGSNVRLLKKSQLTLEDTFYSTQGKSWNLSCPMTDLGGRDRKAFSRNGKLTEEELKTLEEQYEKK